MIFWFITNFHLSPDKPFPTDAIQDIRTAMALADRGHKALIWSQSKQSEWEECIKDQFGCEISSDVHFHQFSHSIGLGSVARALFASAPPDAVISRNLPLLRQLRQSPFLSSRRKFILEYRIPHWMEEWRRVPQTSSSALCSEANKRLQRLKLEEKESLKCCSGILFSPAARRRVSKSISFTGLTDVLPPGCLNPDEEPHQVKCEYQIGYVGALEPASGVHVLLESLRKLPPQKVLIVGSGSAEYQQRLKNLADQLLPHQTTFQGHVPAFRIRDVMRKCEVGVVPTSARHGAEKRDYSLNSTIFEWFAAEVPVIASAVPSIAATIDHSQLRLVPPNCPSALAEVVRELLANENERERLRRNAVFGSQLYSFKNRAARIEAFVHRLSK